MMYMDIYQKITIKEYNFAKNKIYDKIYIAGSGFCEKK